MKKNIILVFVLLFSTLSLLAGPAYPGRIVYTQPDGSTIGIYLHGDEWGHWATDDAGNIIEQDADGYWRISNRLSRTTLESLQEQAAQKRAAAAQVRAEYAQKASSANFGSPRIPVILVGFSDRAFSKTAAQFDAFFNTEGYSENRAIGSVLDYYRENSFGQFTPQFEVLGPVRLDNNMAYYGSNKTNGDDQSPEMALVHAAKKLDGTVDFSRYDNDGDGTVEFVIFYYAGYDEAQGASTNAIWSHAWYISSGGHASANDRMFDGVYLNRYFCTAELKGSSGSTMCSIGTTCHEFAHTLGLPDFYDANGSTNGDAANMYDYDLMASGSYNADSTTPPYLNSEELTEIGWLSAIPELTATGSVTLPAINYPGATAYSAYMTKTSVSGEYFVYETRGGQRWDADLPTGLLVYHVDKSSSYASRWSSNAVNNYSAHPCCYVIPAKNPTSLTNQFTYVDNSTSSLATCMFGSTYKTYTPTAWNGNQTGFTFTNITYSGTNHTVTFNVTNANLRGISGTVMDSDGEPISGATISVTATSATASASAMSIRKGKGSILLSKVKSIFHSSSARAQAIAKAASYTITTAGDGSYLVELPAGTYQIMASKDGYLAQTVSVTVTSVMVTQNFYLMREGEEAPSVLATYPDDAEWGNYGNTQYNLWPLLLSNIYPVSHIGPYVGKQIKYISFVAGGDAISNCHVIVDFGDVRQLALPIEEPEKDVWTTVDVRDQELIIPSGKDVFVGYGGDIYGNYPIWATETNDPELIGYLGDFDLSTVKTASEWSPFTGRVFAIDITVGDYEAPDMGYNFIEDPQNGSYSAGDVIALNLIETQGDRKPGTPIAWYLDDEPVSGTSVTLTSGTHVIEAWFTTIDGKNKIVELEVSVN